MPTTQLSNPTAPDPATAHLVEAFLQAIAAGDGAAAGALYADDAVADLTVPNWRFTARGPAEIGKVYAGWFADPGAFDELEVRPTSTGVVVDYLLTWEEHGTPHAAHHCHILDVVDGRIAHDVVFCGGRWSASLLAQMEEAARGR